MFLHRYFAALYLPEATGSLSTQRRERVKKKVDSGLFISQRSCNFDLDKHVKSFLKTYICSNIFMKIRHRQSLIRVHQGPTEAGAIA